MAYDLTTALMPHSEMPSEEDNQRRLSSLAMICHGHVLSIPDGFRLLVIGEVVQHGDYMIKKSPPGKLTYQHLCCESVGRIVDDQESDAADPNVQGMYFFIRKVSTNAASPSAEEKQ